MLVRSMRTSKSIPPSNTGHMRTRAGRWPVPLQVSVRRSRRWQFLFPTLLTPFSPVTGRFLRQHASGTAMQGSPSEHCSRHAAQIHERCRLHPAQGDVHNQSSNGSPYRPGDTRSPPTFLPAASPSHHPAVPRPPQPRHHNDPYPCPAVPHRAWHRPADPAPPAGPGWPPPEAAAVAGLFHIVDA